MSCELDEPPPSSRATLTPNFSSNLKKFASNNSISGSQTLKTLPEIMSLHDFTLDGVGGKREEGGASNNNSSKIGRAKGLLERRGSNASLTIDLGAQNCILEKPPVANGRLNGAKSVSNLNLSTFGSTSKCACLERRQSQETCGNCIIYESVPSKSRNTSCRGKCGVGTPRRFCGCTSIKCRRKSLSNENLYVPPCAFCQVGAYKECTGGTKQCKGNRKACYPRQADFQALSEDFKMHLQNVEYLQTAGNPLTVEELRMACKTPRVPMLHTEFWEVPLNLQEKCYVSGSQSRNRYKGVLPNEHSRVHLPNQSYIHANFIKGPDYTETVYIATQGPMLHTCVDFWDMIWHTNCCRVVMLTGLVEKGRSKCELYFPLGRKDFSAEKSFLYVKTTRERDKFTFGASERIEEEIVEFEEVDRMDFGDYTITHKGEEVLEECVVRRLEVTKREARETRELRHYWFPNWQDHKMACPDQILKMALSLLRDTPEMGPRRVGGEGRRKSDGGVAKSGAPPIIIHCSAGIGRTGCFLAILNGIQQLRSGNSVDILAILCSLRLNRGGMVQTAEQYELVHKVLALYSYQEGIEQTTNGGSE